MRKLSKEEEDSKAERRAARAMSGGTEAGPSEINALDRRPDVSQAARHRAVSERTFQTEEQWVQKSQRTMWLGDSGGHCGWS